MNIFSVVRFYREHKLNIADRYRAVRHLSLHRKQMDDLRESLSDKMMKMNLGGEMPTAVFAFALPSCTGTDWLNWVKGVFLLKVCS